MSPSCILCTCSKPCLISCKTFSRKLSMFCFSLLLVTGSISGLTDFFIISIFEIYVPALPFPYSLKSYFPNCPCLNDASLIHTEVEVHLFVPPRKTDAVLNLVALVSLSASRSLSYYIAHHNKHLYYQNKLF